MKNNQAQRKHVTLTVTEACNLDCIYCYENHKSNNVMSYETAEFIVKKELLANDNYQDVSFEFFGGEPLLEFETIKRVYSYIWDNNWSKNRLCSATTNGTLIHGSTKRWLEEHKEHFWCCLSLDGTREMHNINRSNSFDSIDFEFFKKMWPEQGIKMTISDFTLPNFADGVIFAHSLGFEVSCNLAYGIDWEEPHMYRLLEEQLNILVEYYLENPSVQPCSMLSMAIEQTAFDRDINKKWCGAGTQMHTYDVHGNEYPCQFFMPLSIGKEKAQEAKHIVFEKEIPDNKLDVKCRNCFAKSICPTCYGANYLLYGDIYKKNETECKLNKLMLLACSYFKYKQFELNQLNLSNNEELLLLKGIEKIQTELS